MNHMRMVILKRGKLGAVRSCVGHKSTGHAVIAFWIVLFFLPTVIEVENGPFGA